VAEPPPWPKGVAEPPLGKMGWPTTPVFFLSFLILFLDLIFKIKLKEINILMRFDPD
jgi:hypothetical protein